MRDISLFEERYERIYKFKEKMEAKELEKRLKKMKLPFRGKTIKALAEALSKLTNGRYSVREVWRKIKVIYPNINLTPNDIAEVYELLEYYDIVEYVGSKKVLAQQPVAKPQAPTAPAAAPVAPPTPVVAPAPPSTVDALKQAILDIRSDMEAIKKEFEELFSTLEEGATEAQPAPIPKERIAVEEIIKAGSKKLFEKLFQINQYIEYAIASTKEGDPIVSASRFGTEFVTEGAIATALAVVLHTSVTSSDSLGMGRISDVMVYTTNGIMIIKPFMQDYFMAFLVRSDARLGLVLRDVEALMSELEKMIKEMTVAVRAKPS